MKKRYISLVVVALACASCGASATVSVSAQATTSTALVVGSSGGVSVSAVGGATVTQERRIDTNNIQYIVREASGLDQASAEQVALASAVVQAARELTDDTNERLRLATHVSSNIARYIGFSSRANGENAIDGIEQVGSMWKVNMHVGVNIGEVRRQLETGRDRPRSSSNYTADASFMTLLRYPRAKFFQNGSNRSLR